jgi:trans-aconitate 2-methyltransferase
MPQWNPEAYLRFADERTQPSYDLAARIEIAHPTRVIDIGCGPGNSTRVLSGRWPGAQIVGLDSSLEMIAKARQTYPRESWILADAADWRSEERYDVVFSNAALQWIPDHSTLLPRLFALLNDGGALAVQVPQNYGSPLYKAVVTVAGRAGWRAATAGCDELLTYHDAAFYYDRLSALAGRVCMWFTTYFHVMAGHQDLIAWYASTGMRPYLERLAGDEERSVFQGQVLEECRAQYPRQQDGKILFPFARLFFVAYKE